MLEDIIQRFLGRGAEDVSDAGGHAIRIRLHFEVDGEAALTDALDQERDAFWETRG